jgi:GT2 family glycosyltransferase
MKVSVVIPFYEVNPQKREVLKECTNSLKGHDEIIIVWNQRMGYAPSINKGLENSRGDYIVVMNDDVVLMEGDLKQLCIPGTVTSPSFMGKTYPHIWGSCFCIPRSVYERIGGMDERYTISYFDDDDLIFTLIQNAIPMKAVPEVVFDHKHPGLTLDAMPDRNEFFEANKQKFVEKWGRLP